MSSNPDQIEHDLANTRGAVRRDVDQFNEAVSPKAVVSTRVERVKKGGAAMKDRLMGAADPEAAKSKAADLAGTAQDATNAAAAKLGDAAGNAPDAVRSGTQGNPLAAGVIAFGVGWLLSSLAPATSAEKDAAQKLQANAGSVLDPLTDSAKTIAGNLQQPVKEAAEHVQNAASDAVSDTAEHAKSATSDVTDQLNN